MAQDAASRRVIVVGSGTRFLSGISVYTVRLANALAERHQVGLITMRRLLPARLYPGWRRVGADLARLEHDPRVSHFDGVDWYWLPSMLRAIWFMIRRKPEIVILEWWTGAVVHSYLALAVVARLLRARIVIEFHEVIATEELGMRLANRWVKTFVPVLMRMADAYAVHSEYDRKLAAETWRISSRRPVEVLPVGAFDHYQSPGVTSAPIREAPPECTNVLFFGVIRQYKGLEILVQAFEQIPDVEIGHFWLTVVGETWEDWTAPARMIESSDRRSRITFVNRYVSDQELDGYMRGADAIALPYLRSSLSGPLHVAMGYGLPIVMSDVGGNAETARGYEGLELVPAGDATALRDALRRLPALRGERFAHPQSWANTALAYERLLAKLERPLEPGQVPG